MDEEFEKLTNKVSSEKNTLSPEEKALLDEANSLLKHCEEEEDFGPTQNPAKLDLQKFLFLKSIDDNYKVNKFLIYQLRWIAERHILLRYLLIEASLNHNSIKEILEESNFFSINNDPEEFYFENNVPEELRFSETMLKIKLSKYSILTPEDASYLVITSITNKFIKKNLNKLISNLKMKMEYPLQVLIYSNKYKNIKARPSAEKLKEETNRELKKYYKSISQLYAYWAKSLVDAEFVKKSHYVDGSYIVYLNNMYYLNSEIFQKFLEGFFFFPNLLIELYDKHTIGAEYYLNKIADYADKIESESKASVLRAKEMSGKKISREDMDMYKEILSIKEDYSCSYSRATKLFSEKKKLFWKPNKIKSISETIRKNHKNGLII